MFARGNLDDFWLAGELDAVAHDWTPALADFLASSLRQVKPEKGGKDVTDTPWKPFSEPCG
jgi:hypothetical protein